MNKVYVTRLVDIEAIEYLKKHFSVEVFEEDSAVPRQEFLERIKDADAVITVPTDKIDAAAMDAGRNVKIFANCAVGYDNMDVAEAVRRGICYRILRMFLVKQQLSLLSLLIGCAKAGC